MAYMYNLDKDNWLGEGTFGHVYAIDDETVVKQVVVGGSLSKKQLITSEIKFMLDLKL